MRVPDGAVRTGPNEDPRTRLRLHPAELRGGLRGGPPHVAETEGMTCRTFMRNVSTAAATHTLPKPVHVTEQLTGLPNPVAGAAVQVLCANCTGIARSRPSYEVASDQFGKFVIVVPDPGTM